ncbi:MAG: integrase arm-type DNA-binding domain-containing protein, partial [Burkholderiaceae bacterium]|nr:integrase arm-type DNA-binding domain-containing protein [Burkholderiaceae bacterium]
MALTDTFAKNVKPTGSTAGNKYKDGQGLYLHVKDAGKYWRMSYRFNGKQKTLALGVYPEVSLAKARQRREKARELLADGIDPAIAKREEKQAKAEAAGNTFEAVAEQWLKATAAKRAAITQDKVTTWLRKDVFPYIGKMPITTIGPRDVLAVVRKMEARGVFDSAKRIGQICGQVFRYAVAEGTAERDITTDLRGAFQHAEKKH